MNWCEELLDRLQLAHPEQLTLRTTDRVEITAAQEAMLIRAWVRLLHDLGVRPGERVVMMKRNSVHYLLCMAACVWIGAQFVPVNHRMSPLGGQAVAASVLPRLIVGEPGTASQLAATAPSGARILSVGNITVAADAKASFVYSVDGGSNHTSCAVTSCDLLPPPARPAPASLAVIMHSSGTTGTPKGIGLSYTNISASWDCLRWCERQLGVASALGERGAVLTITPLGHIGGLNTFTLDAFFHAEPVIVVNQFDAHDALDLLQAYKVTRMFAVPSIYRLLLTDQLDSPRDLTRLAVALVGGAGIDRSLWRDASAADVPLIPTWGMTETAGGQTALLHPTDETALSLGYPLPSVEAGVWDATHGRVVTDEGREGALAIRSPAVHDYVLKEDGMRPRAHEWYVTGDMIRMGPRGLMTLRGRSHNMLVSGGENIYPEEVEIALTRHRAIAHACVVGLPDPLWGDKVAAVVVAAEGVTTPPTLRDIKDELAHVIGRFKLPKQILWAPALPLGPTGKVDRIRVRDLLLRTTAGSDTNDTINETAPSRLSDPSSPLSHLHRRDKPT